MISGGSRLQDVNRLGQDDALKRVLGSDRIPHATTIGKFLWRFGDDQQDKQRQGLAELRDTTAAVQQEAFGMLPRERRKVATLDWDSSIMKCMGRRRKGRTLRTTIRGATARCTGPWRRPAMCCIWGCGKAIGTPATGPMEVLPGTIERVSKHFRQVRMRADSGYYSQALVKICEQRGVEFFIVAKQHRNLMNAVREIPESHWKSFADRDLQADDRRRRRRRRANLKRKIAIRRPTPGSKERRNSRHDVQAKKLEQSTPLRDQTDADRRQGRPAIVPGRRAAPVRLHRGEQLEAQQRAGVANRAGRGNQRT